MHKKLLSFFIGLVLLVICSPIPKAGAQTKDPILSIRQQYAAINKRTSRYRTVKKPLTGFSLEGGEMTAYFDGPLIVKITATHFGELGRTVEEYYFQQGKLIFVFEKVFVYNRPLSGKVVSSEESRFYFQDGKMIRWLEPNGKRSIADAEEYALKEREHLDISNLLTNGARSTFADVEAP